MTNCLNCDAPLDGKNYCGNCGQKNVRKELNLLLILQDIWVLITDIDNRWWRTFRESFSRPGSMAVDYAEGKRTRYAGPLQYVIVVLAIAFLISPSLDIINPENLDPTTFVEEMAASALLFFSRNPAFYLLMLSPVLAAGTQLFFINKGRSFTETLVLTLYVLGQITLLVVVAISLLRAIPNNQISLESAVAILTFVVLAPIYTCKAFVEFYQVNIVRGYVSSILLYIGFLWVLFGVMALMVSILSG